MQFLSSANCRPLSQLYTKIDSVRARLSSLMPSSGPSSIESGEDATSSWDHFRNSINGLVKQDELSPDCFMSVPDMVRSYHTDRDGDSSVIYLIDFKEPVMIFWLLFLS